MSFIKALESKGYDPEKLKKLFEAENREGDDQKGIKRLLERHNALVRQGIDASYSRSKLTAAIDKAIDVSQSQTTATLLRGLLRRDANDPECQNFLRRWDLTHLLEPVKDEHGLQKLDAHNIPLKKLNIPVFSQVLVPLVAAYARARWGALWDRGNTVPLYSYPPAVPTLASHLACRLITQEIQMISDNMGHRSTERDSIWPTLLYGFCWAFASSPWDIEKYPWMENGKYEEVILKEGIRWTIQHPSKCFWDASVPMHTINSDSGVNWCGYWSVMPFGTLNTKSWNLDRIAKSQTSTKWFNAEGFKLYQEYYPCAMAMPPLYQDLQNSREDKWYSRNRAEDTVQVVTLFDKIVPKEYGLFDLDIPVWFRFIYAGDGVVTDCVPYAFNPASVSVDSYDPNRDVNDSLVLTMIPFQDHLGNLLTNIVGTIRNNLANVTFVNQEAVGEKAISMLENWGDKQYAGQNFVPFSPKKMEFLKADPGQLFYPARLDKQPVAEQIMGLNTFLGVMERVLGFSAQEVGAAASHEQSATEVGVVSQSVSTRLGLTESGILEARQARQIAVYAAWLEYSQRDIDTSLSGVDAEMKKALEKMKFTVEDAGDGSVSVKGSRLILDLPHISAARGPADRVPDAKIAVQMMQSMQMLLSSPEASQALGIEKILALYNKILEYAGIPYDWKFDPAMKKPNPAGMPPEAQQAQQEQIVALVQQSIQQAIQQFTEQLGKEVMQPMGQALQQANEGIAAVGQKLGEHEQAIMQIADRVGQIEQMAAQLPPPAAPPVVQPMMAIPEQQMESVPTPEEQAVAQMEQMLSQTSTTKP